MKEISSGGKVIARLITIDDIKDGLNFFSKDEDFLQIGVWGNYEKGKVLNAHIHNNLERVVSRTHEVLYIIQGSIEATVFDLNEMEIDTIIVKQGQILVLLDCGHGYRVLNERTIVLEVKNGPYLGADVDRRRI